MKTSVTLRARLAVGILVMAACSFTIPGPARAQFGGIVYDPSNYAQNVMTAARSLEQINNQIQQLQNQAASLINEARNLASLPLSTIQTLQSQVDQTRQLLSEAQRIAYDVTDVRQTFAARYKGTALSSAQGQMVANANARWEDSVSAFEDAMKVQAGIVGNLGATRSSVTALIGASQSAAGALQAAQAGNQLLALQTQQLADLTAAIAAQGRAQSIEAARSAATEAEGRERFRRFRRRN
jgi:P-type conjugative transfer protein TrbJ